MLDRIKAWLERLEHEVMALWFACRHPDMPWYSKAWVALVVGYALSPIDLIPDFIPVIGLLDDLLLVPIGIWIALKLIPQHVMVDARSRAAAWEAEKRAKPRSRKAAVVVALIWLCALALIGAWGWHAYTAWLLTA